MATTDGCRRTRPYPRARLGAHATHTLSVLLHAFTPFYAHHCVGWGYPGGGQCDCPYGGYPDAVAAPPPPGGARDCAAISIADATMPDRSVARRGGAVATASRMLPTFRPSTAPPPNRTPARATDTPRALRRSSRAVSSGVRAGTPAANTRHTWDETPADTGCRSAAAPCPAAVSPSAVGRWRYSHPRPETWGVAPPPSYTAPAVPHTALAPRPDPHTSRPRCATGPQDRNVHRDAAPPRAPPHAAAAPVHAPGTRRTTR
eukprot:ctg_5629.g842